jgi:hypothetical protein
LGLAWQNCVRTCRRPGRGDIFAIEKRGSDDPAASVNPTYNTAYFCSRALVPRSAVIARFIVILPPMLFGAGRRRAEGKFFLCLTFGFGDLFGLRFPFFRHFRSPPNFTLTVRLFSIYYYINAPGRIQRPKP